jgi:hypothetical protein
MPSTKRPLSAADHRKLEAEGQLQLALEGGDYAGREIVTKRNQTLDCAFSRDAGRRRLVPRYGLSPD